MNGTFHLDAGEKEYQLLLNIEGNSFARFPAQKLEEEITRVFREEKFPAWLFPSFSRCSKFLSESLIRHQVSGKSNQNVHQARGNVLNVLVNSDQDAIRSCLLENCLRIQQTSCSFREISLDVDDSEFDERSADLESSQLFAAFCAVMRDRSIPPFSDILFPCIAAPNQPTLFLRVLA